jgi:DNA-binding IclR family transcriptional regulator
VSQSVGRALRILGRLGDGPAGLDELAEAVGVHKTTVLRLLRTLAEQHFVFRDQEHRYHLGARLHELSSRGLDQREVRGIAAPHLRAFNRDHGHTTHLCERVGPEIVYLDKLEPRAHVRMASRIGARAPVHATAAGKVLIAGLPEPELAELLADLDLTAATPHTLTGRAELRAELDRVRERGWAHDGQEYERSVNCIGAPVRDASGRAVAAVSVSVPTIVLTDEQLLELVPALLAVTERISRDCGWRSPATPSAGGTTG